MELSKQVITISQAKKLKELGITAEAIWYWVYQKDGQMSKHSGLWQREWAIDILFETHEDGFDHEMSCAYGVAELGLMLPAGYDTMYCTGEGWRGYDHDGDDFQIHAFNTEAECRASMLIELLQRNLIAAEEVNQRLLSK